MEDYIETIHCWKHLLYPQLVVMYMLTVFCPSRVTAIIEDTIDKMDGLHKKPTMSPEH